MVNSNPGKNINFDNLKILNPYLTVFITILQMILKMHSIISYTNTFHRWTPPPPPLIKGGGEDLPKIESFGRGEVQNFLLERGNKPVKGRLM